MELCKWVLLPGCSNTSVTNRCGRAVITLIRYSTVYIPLLGHVFKLISAQTGYEIYSVFHVFFFMSLYSFCFITVLFHFNELFIFLKVCLLSLFCSKRLKFTLVLPS